MDTGDCGVMILGSVGNVLVRAGQWNGKILTDNSDFLQKLKDMKENSKVIQDLKKQREELLKKDNENETWESKQLHDSGCTNWLENQERCICALQGSTNCSTGAIWDIRPFLVLFQILGIGIKTGFYNRLWKL